MYNTDAKNKDTMLYPTVEKNGLVTSTLLPIAIPTIKKARQNHNTEKYFIGYFFAFFYGKDKKHPIKILSIRVRVLQ